MKKCSKCNGTGRVEMVYHERWCAQYVAGTLRATTRGGYCNCAGSGQYAPCLRCAGKGAYSDAARKGETDHHAMPASSLACQRHEAMAQE